MDKFTKILGNIKGSIKTTVTGAILALSAMYVFYINDFKIEYTSVEVGIFLAGIWLFFLEDKEEDDKEQG
jgi:uncharacterized membrane protein YobD (UPF0266 family)